MPSTYSQIATTTTSGNQTSVTFSSIPQTYTNLVLVVGNVKHSYAGSGAVFDAFLRFNSDTATNYSGTYLEGDGSSAVSERNSNRTSISSIFPMASAGPGNIIANIPSYSNATTYKTVLMRANVTAGNVAAIAGLWRSTAAITSLTCILSGSYYYIDGSVFSLYGIKGA
jgi:hypothetical protein